MTSKQKWILVGIIVLAIFFRFYLIKTMPGGLFPDEAANGLDINSMQHGDLQPFYERGNGREALFFYMLWGSVEIFGKGPWQHHIVSALVGSISVFGCFLVTRELFSMFAKNKKSEQRAVWLALLAAFFMATSSWHTVLSRTAFRANLIPLFTTYTFYFLILAFREKEQTKRYIYSAITGALFALGFYTYIAYRIMVPLVAIAVFWPLAADFFTAKKRFATIQKYLMSFVYASLSFVVFIAPIARYFYTHAGSFVGRSGQVSVFNPELNHGDLIGTILEVLRKSIMAYFTHGDLNWRHNISGQPFLSIIISPLFAIGLVTATLLAARYAIKPIKYKADWVYFLLAGWFWSMLIPVITTAEGIPHGLRSIGTIPEVFIFAAIGFMLVHDKISAVSKLYWDMVKGWKRKLLLNARMALLIVFFASIISQTYILYFVYAANSPENFYSFRSDLTPVSDYLKKSGDKNNTYLVLDKFSVQTVDYFTTVDGRHPSNPLNNPYQQVDPEDSWKLDGLKNGDKIVFTQSSIFDIKKFKLFHPEAHLAREDRNKFGQTVMAVYIIYK